MNIHVAHSYWKQGALGAAGQACMGWSWTAVCGAYRGAGISWRPPAYSLLLLLTINVNVVSSVTAIDRIAH